MANLNPWDVCSWHEAALSKPESTGLPWETGPLMIGSAPLRVMASDFLFVSPFQVGRSMTFTRGIHWSTM